jgi:hypothetical protein
LEDGREYLQNEVVLDTTAGYGLDLIAKMVPNGDIWDIEWSSAEYIADRLKEMIKSSILERVIKEAQHEHKKM